MREYIIKYNFSLKHDIPEALAELINENSPNHDGFLIADLNPSEIDAAALWAARNHFEEVHTTQMIWYIDNLSVTSVKVTN